MISYIFTTYGSVSLETAGRYTAIVSQFRSLADASKEMHCRLELIRIEKRLNIDGIGSLPKLQELLAFARKRNERVFMDDFRRLFSRCLADKRRKLIKELGEFQDVFWELRDGGRSFGDLDVADLQELRSCVGAIRTRKGKATKASEANRSPELARLQTKSARISSIESRKRAADAQAKAFMELRNRLLRTHSNITLKQLADLMNREGIQTARGGTWSPATIKRMLDRAEKLANDT